MYGVRRFASSKHADTLFISDIHHQLFKMMNNRSGYERPNTVGKLGHQQDFLSFLFQFRLRN
jgi:hypothetical protein